MPVARVLDKASGQIAEVTIGATKANGGSRASVVKVGGETAMPFMFDDGVMPNAPVVGMEVWDMQPTWPDHLAVHYKDVWNNPVAWAAKCQEKFGAQMICIRLIGTHPDNKNFGPDDAVKVVKAVKGATGLPIMVIGCDVPEKDNAVLPAVSQALAGERALIGFASQNNYKTLAATCIADGHNILTSAPLDVNIGKQVNILVTDMGIPIERVIQLQTTAALGYGLEYCFSAQERIRQAGLGGDKMLAIPMLATVGYESWRAKEAKVSAAEFPAWGPEDKRGPAWEVATAVGVLLSGADILLLNHPEAVAATKKYVKSMM
ncbi:MAG: acetyl-CoA decarbonylase/synthase complex subunit delta [Planctomycetota bacterium]|nr:acetyl-CoA decarbonylase/synthase complex subunit delta [Planctomycetota bacterium]